MLLIWKEHSRQREQLCKGPKVEMSFMCSKINRRAWIRVREEDFNRRSHRVYGFCPKHGGKLPQGFKQGRDHDLIYVIFKMIILATVQ